MEAKIYNSKGKEAGKIELPESVFALNWNADLVHQVATSMMTAARTPVAHVKDRGEVRGGGKKPWKQKGTGRARHGSSRSPIWVGGGVAHGPRNDKNFDRKINKKARSKALATILSAKLKDGEVIFVDSLDLKAPKTSEAAVVLKNLSTISGFEKLSTKKTNTAFIITSKKDINAEKSFQNFGNIEVKEIRNISPLDLLSKKFIIISSPADSIEVLEGRMKEIQKAK